MSKDFNFKQNGVQSWLNTEDYQYPAVFDIESFRGSVCLGGADLSETTDMTSAKILMLRKDDRTKYIFQHYWIPEWKLESAADKQAGADYPAWAKAGLLTICEGNEIDLTQVADWFYRLYKDYGIRLFMYGYDVKFSKQFTNRMNDYGFEGELILQNKPTLSNAVKLCEADFRSRLINYNQNPIDAWNFGNASLEVDNLGNCQVVKIAGQPCKRVDGAVTLTICYEMLRRYRNKIIEALR